MKTDKVPLCLLPSWLYRCNQKRLLGAGYPARAWIAPALPVCARFIMGTAVHPHYKHCREGETDEQSKGSEFQIFKIIPNDGFNFAWAPLQLVIKVVWTVKLPWSLDYRPLFSKQLLDKIQALQAKVDKFPIEGSGTEQK